MTDVATSSSTSTVSDNAGLTDDKRRLQGTFGSSKIAARHIDRQAVVYVRQSNPQQVIKHQESAELQYNLVQLAEALGWNRDRVVVVDEDQGITAQNAEGRKGFQWLLAEVALDHVGIVLGIEMSRLARSCKDWYQLLEACALFGTLLADQDGVYDPSNYNDRLLLGLKGTMSEAELHIMQGRLNAGRLNKARRGELFSHPPIGYVRSAETGRHELDPDEQVQHVVRVVFEKFEEIGSVSGVLKYLARNEIKIGVRPHGGPDRGQLQWRRPVISTLTGMLHSPTYAGAYSYGRQLTDRRRKKPGKRGSGKVKAPMDQWYALEQGKLPAYITWKQFLANQERISQNRIMFPARGAVRNGPTLLGGILVCGQCGYRMSIDYSGSQNVPHYFCKHKYNNFGEAICQRVSSPAIDVLIEQQVHQVLQPASLELSLQARQDIEQERARLNEHGRQQLERAKYEVDRAFRQYNATDPDNRLVARELERRWEQALSEQQGIQQSYERTTQERPTSLTVTEVEQVESLANTIPALWAAETTTYADRQEIVRCLVERVTITVQGKTEVADVKIEWVGDLASQHQILRPVGRWEQLQDFETLMARIRELRASEKDASEIAEQLNKDGFHPPKLRGTFNADCVRHIWNRCEKFDYDELLKENEWWLSDLSERLGVPQPTIHDWRRKGWIHNRKSGAVNGRWILWADDDELERLTQLRDHPRNKRYPTEWKTPKPR